MMYTMLNTLVVTAVVNPEFCAKLLNGERRAVIADFDLTEEEREAVMAVRADTIETFAAGLDEWLQTAGPSSPFG
jgi:hypothetical protein